MKHPQLPVLGGLLILLTFVAPALPGQDVAAIFLFKAAWYEQNTAGDPQPMTAVSDPFDVTATVYPSDELLRDPEWYLWVSGVTLRTPAGRTEGLALNIDADSFDLHYGAVSQQALDLRYGSGNYRFIFSSLISGDSVYNVPLTAADYPPAPKCTNFDAAQKVDPTKDFTLRWVDFTGSGQRSIQFAVMDQADATGFDAGSLDGDETSVTIPAGTLLADTANRVLLTFTRYTYVSGATVPETYSGFDAYNAIPLKTIAGGAAPDPSRITAYRVLENGDLELTVTCTPDRPLTVLGGAALEVAWSNLQTTTPSSSSIALIVPKASLGDRLFIRLFQE